MLILYRHMERKSTILEAAVAALQEDLLLVQCSTVDELEELNRSLAQPEIRNQMVINWT